VVDLVVDAIPEQQPVQEIRARPVATGRTWLTTAQVTKRAQPSTSAIVAAAGRGDLHGHQTMRKGKWAFATAAVDAGMQGQDGRAQRQACGCDRHQAVRASGRLPRGQQPG
jgi:hypothetical protein